MEVAKVRSHSEQQRELILKKGNTFLHDWVNGDKSTQPIMFKLIENVRIHVIFLLAGLEPSAGS